MTISIDRNRNGIPYLCKRDIEEIAYTYLKRFNTELLKSPAPTPIEQFVENYLKLEMDYIDITPDESVLGMTIFDSGFITVYNSENQSKRNVFVKEGTVVIENALLKPSQENRYRFTCGHEAGHWILHRNVFKKLIQTNTKANICLERNVRNMPKKKLETDEDWMEWQANYLCSCLLMPQMTFRYAAYNILRKAGIKADYVNNAYAGIFYYICSKLADAFNVSLQAAYIRLKELNIIRETL